jgi:hypothetical protein
MIVVRTKLRPSDINGYVSLLRMSNKDGKKTSSGFTNNHGLAIIKYIHRVLARCPGYRLRLAATGRSRSLIKRRTDAIKRQEQISPALPYF